MYSSFELDIRVVLCLMMISATCLGAIDNGVRTPLGFCRTNESVSGVVRQLLYQYIEAEEAALSSLRRRQRRQQRFWTRVRTYVGSFLVCSIVKQQRQNNNLILLNRAAQGRHVPEVARVDRGATLEQQASHRDVSDPSGAVQWRSFFVDGFNVGA